MSLTFLRPIKKDDEYIWIRHTAVSMELRYNDDNIPNGFELRCRCGQVKKTDKLDLMGEEEGRLIGQKIAACDEVGNV